MRKLIHWFWISLLHLQYFSGWGQSIRFTKIPSQFESGGVLGMAQDKQGYLWIATKAEGIQRYDGNEFVKFVHKDGDPNTLGNNWAECLAIDSAGIIWVGFYGQGLDRFDPFTLTFRHFRHSPKDPSSLTNDTVTSIIEDHSGNLWVGNYGGLDLFERKKVRFTHYTNNPNDPTTLSSGRVRVIYEDHQGGLWVGCGTPFYSIDHESKAAGGLNRFNRLTGKFTRYLHDPNDPSSLSSNKVSAIYEDSKGNFWVGTALDGLHSLDRSSGKFVHYYYDPKHPEKLSAPPLYGDHDGLMGHIRFIGEDITGSIWIGHFPNGLNRFDPETQKTKHYGYAFSDQGIRIVDTTEGFNDSQPWQFLSGGDGMVWISTQNGYLYSINPSRTTIPYNRISEKSTGSFYMEPDGHSLWICTEDGLVQRDLIHDTKRVWKHDSTNPHSLIHNYVTCIRSDGMGKFWVATVIGLCHFDPINGSFEPIVHKDSNAVSQGCDYILNLFIDRKNQLWIASGCGLELFDQSTHSFVHQDFKEPIMNGMGGLVGFCVAEDNDRNRWFATSRGIWESKYNGTIASYFGNVLVKCVFVDSAGVVWAGNNAGLYYFDKTKLAFVEFRDPNSGLLFEPVLNILEDDQKNLWVSTKNSIVRINPGRNFLNVFGFNNGVHENSLFFSDNFKATNGKLILFDQTGYYLFFPNKINTNDAPPRVNFENIKLGDHELLPSANGPLKESILKATQIQLPFDLNTFSFDFSAIHYNSPGSINYAFMLENYSGEWHHIGAGHIAYFFNVPPGKYVFRVKAINADGIAGEKSIDVLITPPWWKTWWAYTIFILTFFGLIWGFVAYRSKHLRIENKKLEEKVTHRTEELRQSIDNLTKTQAQLIQSEKMASLGEITAGIAHEIQNPLNFINNFAQVNEEFIGEAEDAIKKGQSDDAINILHNLKENQKKINQHGQRADSIVKGMLQHSRTSSGQKEPTDLNALVDEYLRLSYHGWKAREKSAHVNLKKNLDPSIKTINVVSQDLGRVILNLCNNAFYAVSEKSKSHPNGYEPTVEVSTSQLDHKVEINIRDNGNGIHEAAIKKIFQPFFTTKPTGQGTGLGLSLAYDIIKAQGGTIKVYSQENEGAEFVIELPIE
jgi:signal transduction histidine kinase/ligand-binding sensor domain-containing protein